MSREAALGRAFVELADTLVGDYAVADLLQMLCERCASILDVAAAGVLLTDERGRLRLSSASNEQTRVLELFEAQQEEGPCLDAYSTGEQVNERDIVHARDRWPVFAQKALDAGFRAVFAVPLRLRGDRIGALNMFRVEPGELSPADLRAAQALADVAAIGILQRRAVTAAQVRVEQLQQALDSRVVIEQAKGIIAERLHIDPEEAFERLRRHARANQRRLHDTARLVIEGAIGPG
ncbi:MAG: GAF and ANTAR domain-containing protein [Euzebyales bacterium]|nr:GAF and ANTAR domain-containing protein [Euzebyales bacterium]